ncbi:cytochrome c biogenesis protein ResB [Iodobacter ciconiae]|uniref:Cytochrome c biogenesis protein ResB n=1 Tax=Iodobacter ciconiae TaxID=2496266 RepID=A0A3S8ZVC9_9NEIS|nr:cytochrome c biogenesis protein ResB [Iodobacter ciconiae]AZN37421.1 cytochrome c biogenesis protein ResB [Iodobacter ciconiae]
MTPKTSFLKAWYELFSSMRFAVSLLTILAISSVIGTVLKQNEPYANYKVEFGEFWFQILHPLGLFDVYHSTWFLLILCFLVLSTSLCIWRQMPGIWKDIRGYRENASNNSLRLMSHHTELTGELPTEEIIDTLASRGYRIRTREENGQVSIAAKKGSFQRLGYLFAHAAIVVICLGGLLDGNVPLKLTELFGFKTPETRNLPQSKVSEQSRLPEDNLSFRGNVTLPEGSVGDVIFLNAGQGYFVQELPFAVRLNKFYIEHYSTGQPKLFASDIDLLDKKSGSILKRAKIEVNKPLIYKGVAVYQASFGDGGSLLEMRQWDLNSHHAQALNIRSQTSESMQINGQAYQLEMGDFRSFNIENTGKVANSAMAVSKFAQAMASAQAVQSEHNLKNIGPSIQFKLRDKNGQATEYLNYFSPFFEKGAGYAVTGMRTEVAAPFQFVRIPLDKDLKPDSFMRLRASLLDKSLYPEIARRTAAKAFQSGGITKESEAQFKDITIGVLTRFSEGGFPAIESFLEQKVPKEQRQTVAQTYIKILQGTVIDAMDVTQGRAGLPILPIDETQYRFLMDSLVAVSSLFEYGPPVWLQASSFNEIKASGFQITRAPGQNIVYLGSLLLVIGIFCMFYIRENRVWVRLAAGKTLIAMSSNRKNSDLDREFLELTTDLAAKGKTP